MALSVLVLEFHMHKLGSQLLFTRHHEAE